MPQELLSKKNLLYGTIIGLLTFLCPIIIMIAIMVFLLAIFIKKQESRYRTILSRIIISALLLRLLFSLLSIFYIYSSNTILKNPLLKSIIGHTSVLFRDFGREAFHGTRLAMYFNGEFGNISIKEVAHGSTGAFLHFGAYTQGVLNYIFGQAPANLFFYSMIGVGVVVLTYVVAKDLFNDEKIAIISSFLAAIMPSFIIWSSSNIRTTIGIISLLLISSALIRFAKHNKPRYIFIIIFTLFVFWLVKDKFANALLPIVFLLLLFNLKIEIKRKIILLFCLFFLFNQYYPVKDKVNHLFKELVITQRNFVDYPHGNNYKIYDDYIYSVNLEDVEKIPFRVIIKGLASGSAYYLFSPFPWKITNNLRLYSYPQIILWYSIFLFSIIGILIGIRYKTKETFVILLYLLYIIVVMSLANGNEGIAARHRDFISPFFFIFASAGICNLLGCLESQREEEIKDSE